MAYEDAISDEESVPLNTPMNNKTYDRLKFVAQVFLPALGTLYFTLGQIWGLPKVEEVVGTITAVDALLGVLLGVSSRQYKNVTEGPHVGFIDVSYSEEGTKRHTLNFPGDPDDIDKHDKVTFKVRKGSRGKHAS